MEVYVKIRDINEIEKQNFIGISAFDYEKKVKYSIYVPKIYCDYKHVDLLLIQGEGKRNYVLLKDFNIILYD